MIKKSLLALYVFVLLFSPPIFPSGLRSMYILAAVSLFLLITKYRSSVAKVLAKSNLKIVVRLFVALALYVAVITAINGGANGMIFVDSVAKMLLTGPVLAICLLFLLVVFERNKYTLNDALKIVIWAGLLQVFLAILAFTIPSAKSLFIAVMQNNVGTAALFDPFQIETRLFGFAGDMFDRFGYGVGMMSALPVLLAYNTGKLRYLLMVPLFLVAIILNSRTGLLMAAVSCIPLVIATLYKHATNTRRFKSMIAGIIMLLVSIFGGSVLINNIYETGNQNIQKYTASNYDSVLKLITGGDVESENDNTAELLFSGRFWELPNNPLAFIFGTGHSKYETEGLTHSDVGYVNDIWMFGLIATALVYVVFIYFTFTIARFGIQYRLLAVGFTLTFFLYQIKGVALWSANIGIALHIMTIVFVYYYESRKQKEKIGE